MTEPVRRHTSTAEAFLSRRPDANPVLAETLLGLARCWDTLEMRGDGEHTVPRIANSVMKLVEQIGADESADPWDDLLRETGLHG